MSLNQAYIKHIIRLIAILWCLPTLAQDYDYIQYTTDDGLPTNYIYGVVEDDNGYIWVYTENGMSKFDGYTFRNFSVKDGLPTNDIVNVIKDKKNGKLWLHPYKSNPTYIDVDKDSIVVFSDKTILNISSAKDKVLYTYGGEKQSSPKQLYYEHDSLTFIPKIVDSFFINIPDLVTIDSVRAMPKNWHIDDMQEKNYQAFYSANDSLYYTSNWYNSSLNYSDNRCRVTFLPKEKKLFSFCDGEEITFKVNNAVVPFKIRETNVSSLEEQIKYIVEIKKQFFYILDLEKKTFLPLKMPEQIKEAKSIDLKIYDKTFILSYQKGFVEYDFEGNILDSLLVKDLGEYYTLNTCFKDKKGNIWIGSREGGLFFIPKAKHKTINVSSIYSKDKTFEGLISTNDNKLLGITDNSGIYHINGLELNNVLPANKGSRLRSMVRTDDGIIVSSSKVAHIVKNDGENFQSKALVSVIDHASCKDEEPLFCCNGRYNENYGFHNSLSLVYDPNQNFLYKISYNFNLIRKRITKEQTVECSYQVSNIPILKLYYHPTQKELYIGNTMGLHQLSNNQIIPIIEQDSLFQNILSLYGTTDKIWIGTESNGLYSYVFSTTSFKKISNAKKIRRIRPDTDSTLLIASNEGVLVIGQGETAPIQKEKYTILDGLFSNEIQDVYSDRNFIYVANLEGIQRIDRTQKLEVIPSQKDLILKSVLVNGQDIPIDTSFHLSSSENAISIQYHLMSFASNKRISYYTKLSPLEKTWQKTNERSINYLDLSPNDYSFHLKAMDAYGNEIEHSPIRFHIAPPFWKTIWFLLLSICILIGTIVAIIRYRDKLNKEELKKEKAISRKMAELELSALRAQMNPHFIFNALGAIQYHIQVNEVEAADNYLTSFAKLMRKYLDSSKEKMISLDQEIELLTIYTDLEQLRFESIFTVEIKVAPDLETDDLYLPSMLIQPFIENAVNHGLNERRDGEGRLQVLFTLEGKSLVCQIKDNGIGIENAKQHKRKVHKSRGMSIIDEKIQTLKESGIADVLIEIQNLHPNESQFPGTQVSLNIKNLDNEYL